MQRKSVLQPAIRASCSQHVLAHKSFQLTPKPFLISRIDYNPSVIWISPQKKSTCPSGKLRTKKRMNERKNERKNVDAHSSAGWCHCKMNYFISLRTKITSPIARATGLGLLDTTFFARLIENKKLIWCSLCIVSFAPPPPPSPLHPLKLLVAVIGINETEI